MDVNNVENIPEKFKNQFFDILIIFEPSDHEYADQLKNVLLQIGEEGNLSIEILLFDFQPGEDILAVCEKLFKNSTLHFVLVTQKYCDSLKENGLQNHFKNVSQMICILEEEKKFCFVPVYLSDEKKIIDIPFSFKHISSLKAYHFYNDDPILKKIEKNRFLKMIKPRISIRKDNEDKQKLEMKKFFQDYIRDKLCHKKLNHDNGIYILGSNNNVEINLDSNLYNGVSTEKLDSLHSDESSFYEVTSVCSNKDTNIISCINFSNDGLQNSELNSRLDIYSEGLDHLNNNSNLKTRITNTNLTNTLNLAVNFTSYSSESENNLALIHQQSTVDERLNNLQLDEPCNENDTNDYQMDEALEASRQNTSPLSIQISEHNLVKVMEKDIPDFLDNSECLDLQECSTIQNLSQVVFSELPKLECSPESCSTTEVKEYFSIYKN